MRIALIHALRHSPPPVEAAFARLWPEASLMNLLDDSLSADLVTTDPPLVSTITDSEGDPIAYLFDQYRVLVEPHEIADSMKAAIIAVEDQRFSVPRILGEEA